jgi:hypothetical protein
MHGNERPRSARCTSEVARRSARPHAAEAPITLVSHSVAPILESSRPARDPSKPPACTYCAEVLKNEQRIRTLHLDVTDIIRLDEASPSRTRPPPPRPRTVGRARPRELAFLSSSSESDSDDDGGRATVVI